MLKKEFWIYWITVPLFLISLMSVGVALLAPYALGENFTLYPALVNFCQYGEIYLVVCFLSIVGALTNACRCNKRQYY